MSCIGEKTSTALMLTTLRLRDGPHLSLSAIGRSSPLAVDLAYVLDVSTPWPLLYSSLPPSRKRRPPDVKKKKCIYARARAE